MRSALVALLLLAPIAAAGEGGTIRSMEEPYLRGQFDLTFPGGVAVVVDPLARFTLVLENVSGEADVHGWKTVAVSRYKEPTEPARATHLYLSGARVSLEVDHESFSAAFRAVDGGVLAVAGPVEDRARPTWLVEAWDRYPADASYPYGSPVVPVRADAGWGAVQNDRVLVIGPLPMQPSLLATGSFIVELNGGNMTIDHPNGSSERFRLSTIAENSAGPASITRESRLIAELDIGSMELPLGGQWIVAGPRPEWHIDGSAAWKRASGSERGIPFADQPVHIEGVFTLTPDPSRKSALGPDVFALEGDYSLSAAGIVLSPDPPRATPPIAAWTLAGIVAAIAAWFTSPHLAGRVVAPFYTRIARNDIATHPARALICQHLGAAPGLHLRDLHRKIGGAWGTFSFHLGMLRQAGLIRFEREGRYVAVYLAHQEAGGPAPRTPTAQKVLDALPHDGTALPVTKLRERVGLSRQLLDHHLAALAQQELVVVQDGRPRRVSRKDR